MGERAKIILNEYTAKSLLMKDTLDLDKFYTTDLKMFIEVARKEIKKYREEIERLNNIINNLEYITQRENTIKAVEHGKIKVKSVEQYDKNNNFIKLFKSISEAHRKTNVALSDIHRCCNNERKTAGGYVWKYGGGSNA
jgi:hypothetical protein